MRLVTTVLASFSLLLTVAPACGGDDDGGGETGVDGGPGGTGTDGGGAGSDGGGTTGTDGGIQIDGAASACSLGNDGDSCTAGTFCTWMEGCYEGRCDCESGTWSCTQENVCGAECPMPSVTSCGDACSVEASMCLCRCGGGPNFSQCACTGGSWQCSACGSD